MQVVILAAGQSSRFWPLNQKHKSIFKLMDRPLIYYSLEGLKKSGLKEVIIVQSPKRDIEEELKNYSLGLKVKYVIQKKPLGTGEAILSAEEFIKGQFFVLNAERIDCQNYLKLILAKTKKENVRAILLSAPTKTPWLFGNLKIKGDKILDIIEKPELGKELSNLKNVGIYFLPKEFLNYLKKEPVHPHSFIKALSKYGKEKELKVVNVQKEPFSLKYPWDLFQINEYLFNKFSFQNLKNSEMKNKFSFQNLKNSEMKNKFKTKILGKIEKNCTIFGPVIIEKGSLLKSGTYIEGPVHIGKNCKIGPNCYIRGFTTIGDNCCIGNGSEIKNSIIGSYSNVSHLNYVGDSIIGENCNLGAGVITANVCFDKKIIKSIVKGELVGTGKQKFGCVIGANTQIGINASIMPGVLIGSNCLVGSAERVFKNLKDKTKFYTK